jgi:Flp pilus assembly protein TadD
MTVTVQRCCQAADLALKLGQTAEAASICRHVLAHQRWHLRAHLLLGQASLEREEWSEARQRFRLVLQVDPECAEAWSGLGVIALVQGDMAEAVRALACAFENTPESDEAREALQQALSRQAGRPVPLPAFTPACVGRFYLRRNLPQPAAAAYASALHDAAGRDDLRLAYATALWQAGSRDQAAGLCRPFLNRTPRPLSALLLAGAADFLQGEKEAGRRLWNEARAWDPDDRRAQALFGDTPGLPLPPQPAEVPGPDSPTLATLIETAGSLVSPAPAPTAQATAELAAYVRGVPSAARGPAPTDPDLRRFQQVVQEIDHRLFGGQAPPAPEPLLPPSTHGSRRPAEVILAWEEGLRSHFGTDNAPALAEALQGLAQAAERCGVASRIVYVDRPPYAELPRPDPHDPQQIKSFLDALDRRLGGEELDFQYLTLVGGGSLLPFALLPNPSEDTDEAVPSDNLYASRDPTYLIPERATGRLPDDGSGLASPFLEQLARCASRRRGELGPATSSGCLGALLSWLQAFTPLQQSKGPAERRFGLSAQVWAQASEQVFRLLPGNEALHLCPPDCHDAITPSLLADVPLAYFNLHGAADAPNWYGQRDMATPDQGPLMPVAFSPEHVPAGRVEGIVVYSEACYGAHILGKNTQSSVALRFLAEGALGLVGSTVISYGVSTPPLTDADLLGQMFWQHVLRGEGLGDALLQAKIDFTREMYSRQGYLDGDDMKTLLEFVLYGDPLAALGTFSVPSEAHGSTEAPAPPVLCSRHAKAVALHQLSGDLVARVRRSLSWLQQGEAVGNVEVALRSGCPGGCCTGRCPTAQEQVAAGPEALVFSTRREIRAEDGTHIPQWARVVVDPRGHIVKMAVTR